MSRATNVESSNAGRSCICGADLSASGSRLVHHCSYTDRIEQRAREFEAMRERSQLYCGWDASGAPV